MDSVSKMHQKNFGASKGKIWSNSAWSSMKAASNLGELVVDVAAEMISVRSDSEVLGAIPPP